MEALYVEELRSAVNLLMANLESLPVSKGGADFKQKLKRSSMNNSFLDLGDEGDILSKSDVVLSFTLEVGVSHHSDIFKDGYDGAAAYFCWRDKPTFTLEQLRVACF